MTKEEHTEKIMEIKKLVHDTDDGTITKVLADLCDDYGVIMSNLDEVKLSNEKLQKDNESLRDTNMRLFLRVGGDQPKETQQPAEVNQSFEELFNEKGELK